MKVAHVLLACVFVTLSSAQSIPPVKAKALDNTEVTLPQPGSQQVLILILGFSRKGGELCGAWSRRVAVSYKDDSRVAYFSLPVLQSVPSLFRSMVASGIRKGVPEGERRRYVPIYSNESDWKKFVNFSVQDDPYLVVATPDGHAVWQSHGSYSEAMYADLQSAVATLLKKPVTQPVMPSPAQNK